MQASSSSSSFLNPVTAMRLVEKGGRMPVEICCVDPHLMRWPRSASHPIPNSPLRSSLCRNLPLPATCPGTSIQGRQTGLQPHGPSSSSEGSRYTTSRKRARRDSLGGAPLFDLNVPAEVLDKI